jgi:hypothetical protein
MRELFDDEPRSGGKALCGMTVGEEVAEPAQAQDDYHLK